MLVLRIKTGSLKTYDSFQKADNILVDHLLQGEQLVKIGQPVLLIFGGDGTPWNNGLAGFCTVASEPLDLGYETAKKGKYYKLRLDVKIRLKRHLEKIEFARYPQTFDSGVGPSTKGERNQALGIIDDTENIIIPAICRAVIDSDPLIEKDLRSFFGDEIIDISKSQTKVYIDPEGKNKDISEIINLRAREFKNYLQTIAKKSNGEPLSEQSVSNYVSALVQKPFINYLHDKFKLDSLYITENISLLDNICDDLKTSMVDDDSHQTYSSALLRYKEFVLYSFIDVTEPIILYGPPGTGKTFKMQNDYIKKFSKDNCFVTTFHQSFSYEEFVEGIKPFVPEGKSDIQYKVEPGLFYQACEQAAKLAGYSSLDECISDLPENRTQKIDEAIKNNKVALLCIDEINRANVSSVFGDLISLVESSKRLGAEYELTAKLPYSKKDFGVPANLMIVGTMNTADRSIQLLDSALRRRFKFEELMPDYKCLNDKNENEKAEKILRNINNRIRALLDKDHQIGHSYFIGKNTNLEIFNVMKDKIIPLLEEYFYNETDKIRRILNETDELKEPSSHSTDYFYVLDIEAKDAVGDTDDFNEEKPYYKLNEALKKDISEEDAKNFLEHLEK